jgi:betaine-aldehyde dehydrogenase
MLLHDQMFIGGRWERPTGTLTQDVVSPSTEEVVGRVPLANEDDIDRAVASAHAAFDRGPWRQYPVDERRAVLRKAAALLEKQADELGRLLTLENGMLLRSGHGHLGASVNQICDFDYPDTELRVTTSGDKGLIFQEPAGVVAAIVPWNGPLSTIFKVVPALLAGCSVVLKPAPELTLFTYVLAQACLDAGLPEGVLSILIADRSVSEHLVRHPDVDLVSLTGSAAAGRRIASICGEQLKRVHLELGGKSAAIVLDDIDVESVLPKVLGGGPLFNNGQACAAWSRILVPESHLTEMVDVMCETIRQVRIGDPFDPETDLGPLITERQRDRVEGYVALGKKEGATVVIGDRRPAHLKRGWFLEPTLLLGDNTMQSSREEIFGPVSTVITYRTIDEAIDIANDSPYGLSGAVFSSDVEQATHIAQQMRTGTVGINCVGINTELPYGGFKDSGIGRHFGPEGTREFLETKNVSLPRGYTPPDY